MTVLVGGVSELFQGDLDLGRLAVQRLQGEGLADNIFVEDLHYGAVAVTQRIDELQPQTMILVGAVKRGRPPGTVVRRWVTPVVLSQSELQAAVGDAVTGYVAIDLIVEVTCGLSRLPPRTVAIEVEPEHIGPIEGLTPSAAQGLEEALHLVRNELERTPVFGLAAELREMVAGDRLEPSPALKVIRELLVELELLERDARWGRTSALRDRLQLAISAGEEPAGMDGQDWSLWWALLEELNRLLQMDASAVLAD